MINSKPVKRKGPVAMPGDSKKKQKHLIPPPSSGSCSREVRLCTADSRVTFDLPGVTRRNATSDQLAGGSTADRVIGWCGLKGQGVWLVLQDASIACFNVARYRKVKGFQEGECMYASSLVCRPFT